MKSTKFIARSGLLQNAFPSLIRVLNRQEKLTLTKYIVFQLSVSILDFLGIALTGVLGALVVSVVSGVTLPNSLTHFLDVIGMSSDFEGVKRLIPYLFIAILIAFILKTFASIYLSYRLFRFLSSLSLKYSNSLFQKLSISKLTWLNSKNQGDLGYGLTDAALQTFVGFCGSIILITGELIFIFLVVTGLLLVNPVITMILVAFFSLIFIISNKIVSARILKFGQVQIVDSLRGRQLIKDIISLTREIRIMHRSTFFEDSFSVNRKSAANAQSLLNVLQQMPKYILEFFSLVLGLFLVLLTLQPGTVVENAGQLSLYLAAILRILPAVMRLQGGVASMQSSSPAAINLLPLVAEVDNALENFTPVVSKESSGIRGIKFENVTFAFEGAPVEQLKEVSIALNFGEFFVLYGKSGIGKTTFLDLCTGLLQPIAGDVYIDGINLKHKPAEIKMSYVSQATYVTNESIRANVAFGVPEDQIDDYLITEALNRSQLTAFIDSLESGIHTKIGEGGRILSGGERQRLGIARALYMKPSYLFLDEPTSALDPETERDFWRVLQSLRGEMTIIMISHRLEALDWADKCLVISEDDKSISMINSPNEKN